MEANKEPTCASIAEGLKILGDKWTALIVRELSDGPKRFTQLEQALNIGPRTLSQRLDVMEAQWVITKHQYAEMPPRVEYSLTPKGRDLLPILYSLASWGSKYGSR